MSFNTPEKFTKKFLLQVFLLAFTISFALLGALIWYGNHEPLKGGNFTLNHDGKTWTFKDHAKSLNIAYVGYAKCPDICPLTLSNLTSALKKFTPAELSKVQVIFISVDHEHDNAKDVAEYASQFNPSYIGLTGDKEQINKTVKQLGASYFVEQNPESYMGYAITHSDRLFLLNKKGYVIQTISDPGNSTIITETIKELL